MMRSRGKPLQELINIGPMLASRLEAVGISTAEEFRTIGDKAAFFRLVGRFPDDACMHTRLALAGAARGVRHGELPASLKISLKKEIADFGGASS